MKLPSVTSGQIQLIIEYTSSAGASGGGGGREGLAPLNKIWPLARGLARHNKRFTIKEIIKIVATHHSRADSTSLAAGQAAGPVQTGFNITFNVLQHNNPMYLRDLLTTHNPSPNLRLSSQHLLSVSYMQVAVA